MVSPSRCKQQPGQKASSQIEKLCSIIWAAANEVSQKINERDVALAALLYSEMQILVYDTEELAAAIKDPGDKQQAEDAAQRTPLMFEVINPLCGFADIGILWPARVLHRAGKDSQRCAIQVGRERIGRQRSRRDRHVL